MTKNDEPGEPAEPVEFQTPILPCSLELLSAVTLEELLAEKIITINIQREERHAG